MGWNTIRKATREDEDALQAAAERFCERHGIQIIPEFTALDAVNHEIGRDKRLYRLWVRIVRRTLRHSAAEGIAYGYVGYQWN